MIFKTTDDLKKYFSLTSGFTFDSFKPFLSSSLEENIYPWISKTQYTDLDTAYIGNTMTSDQQNLLVYAQRTLAHMAMFKYSFLADKTIGVNGVNVNTDDDNKMIAQWRMEDLREYCLTEYDASVEQLLKFLETNKATYTLWAASTSYTVYKESFINNVDEFHSYFKIGNSRRTFLALKGIMKRVEDFKIKTITGTNLFNQIKTQINTATISSNNQNLLNLIKPAVALLSGARGCNELLFKISSDGLVVDTTSASLTQKVKTNPQAQLITARMYQAIDDGNNYLEQLKNYLFDNHATYPLYEADTKVYVVAPTTNVNTLNSSTYIL